MIKVYKEKNLTDINWSRGAKVVYDLFTEDEIEQLQHLLEDSYPDGIEETELDDLFEHDPEQLLNLLDISDSYEKFYNKRIRDYEYEEEDRYCQRIVGQDDILYSSDDLDDVIASAVADYEWGDSNSDDIEIYDQEERKVVWSTENDEDYHKESNEEDEGDE